MERRWQVTPFQKILIFFALVAAIFFATMGLGAESAWFFVTAASILFGTVFGVAAVVVRRGTAGREVATAKVLTVSLPPVGAGIAAPCNMKVAVLMPGRGRIEAKLRDSSVPLSRWPTVGQTFPVEVIGGNPHRRLHIRWDLVEAGMVRAPAAATKGPSAAAPMWEEEQTPVIYSPTPPRQRRSTASPPPASPPPAPAAASSFVTPPPATVPAATPAPPLPSPTPAPLAMPTQVPVPPQSQQPPERDIYEHFTDPDDVAWDLTERVPPAPSEIPQTVAYVPSSVSGEASNGHDPDGYDPADFEPPLLEAITLHDFDPAHIDRSDFDETPATRPTGEDRTDAAAGIPSPRPAEPATRPAPAARDTPAAAPLPVADLTASLRFYRDVLGGAVVDAGPNSVVIETVGTRVSLEQVTDLAALLPRRGAVHLRVADLEATCAKLVRHGVRLVQPPTPVGDDENSGRWRARLQDPDGHEVELSQMRS